MSHDAVQIVERPDPGLARGRWEAPAWAFWAVVAVTAAAGIVWAVRTLRSYLSKRSPS